MTSSSLFVGRVALAEGRALGGFTVELRVGASTQNAVTDGIGEFRLEVPGALLADPADRPTGELIVRAPSNQVVFRDWYPLDGRYLGVTVPREALPRGTRQGMRPPQPPERTMLVDGLDVGDHGEVLLPRLRQFGVVPGRRVVGVRNRIAVASGATVWIWTVDDGGRAVFDPVEVDVRTEVLDLAGNPLTGEIVLLVARHGSEAGRDLAVLTEDGDLERRWSLDGNWDRLAISPADGAVALVALGSPAWAVAAGGDIVIHELESAARDVAFAGELVILASAQELLSLRLTGDLLGRTEWPGQELVLVAGGPRAVYVYDAASGRATRALVYANGKLAAHETILVGRNVAFGWWWDRSWILTLLKDRLQWWQLAPVVIEPTAPSSDIIFVGPT